MIDYSGQITATQLINEYKQFLTLLHFLGSVDEEAITALASEIKFRLQRIEDYRKQPDVKI